MTTLDDVIVRQVAPGVPMLCVRVYVPPVVSSFPQDEMLAGAVSIAACACGVVMKKAKARSDPRIAFLCFVKKECDMLLSWWCICLSWSFWC